MQRTQSPPPRATKRTPGQFQQERARHQRLARRHAAILAAVATARAAGEAWLELDGLRLRLVPREQDAAGVGTYCYFAIVRTRTLGLRLGRVCTKDRGHVELRGPDLPHGAYVVGINPRQALAFVGELPAGLE